MQANLRFLSDDAAAALQVPGARLALVGDGPQRQELEQMFQGMPVKFMVSWEVFSSKLLGNAGLGMY